MKKPLLISLTALAVLGVTTATTLYAQTATGTSLIDKMKAAVANFTLTSDLNPGETGLQSAPIKGKKTGDVLTAGEYNRLLEMIAQGSVGWSSSWVDVPLTDTSDFDDNCDYRVKLSSVWNLPGWNKDDWIYSPDRIGKKVINWSNSIVIQSATKNVLWWQWESNDTYVNVSAAWGLNITKIEKRCGGGGSTVGSSELQLSNESSSTFPNFIEATKYCKNLSEGGYTDWRFPDLNELFVFAPVPASTNFVWTNAVDYSQWTANANPEFWGKLRLSDGYFSATNGPGDAVAYVRCVRWN